MSENLKGEELIAHIDGRKKEAKEYMAERNSVKEKCERFYKSEHWANGNQKKSVKNFIFSIVEDELPVLCDSIPTTDIISTDEDEESMESAKCLESAVQFSYESGDIPLKVPLTIRDSLKTGTGYIYVDWNQEAEKGQGSVSYTVKNWRSILIDPMCANIDDADFVIIECPMRKSEIERLYPAVKSSDLEQVESNMLINETNSISSGTNGNENHWTLENSSDKKNKYSGRDIFLVDECWLKDYSLEDLDENETLKQIDEEKEQIVNGINPDVSEYEDHEAHLLGHELQLKELVAAAMSAPTEEIGVDGLPTGNIIQGAAIPIDSITDEMIEDARTLSPELGLIIEVSLDHQRTHENIRNPRTEGKRPKYPDNIRLVIKLGSTILYDGAPDCEDGMVPLVPFFCYKESDSFDAIGEIENLIKAQMSYNEMDQNELKGLLLTQNGGWIIDADSEVDPDSLTNEIGMVITKKSGSLVERIQVAPVSPQLEQRKNADRDAMTALSGINRQVSGEAPKSVVAGFAIDKLREQAIGRIKLKSRFVDLYSMKRLAKLTASRIIKYWSQERLLRLYDNDGNLKTVKYDPSKMQNLNYDIKILPSSMAGMDKSSIYKMLSEQVQLGIIPAKTFIRTVDMPYKSMILKDLEENDAVKLENETLKQQLAELQIQIEAISQPMSNKMEVNNDQSMPQR